MLLDTTHNIGTPEGVELRLPVAGVAPRALAWLLDALIKYTALFFLTLVLGLLGDFGGGLYLISVFLLLWFYNVLFEVLGRGATPGKRMLGLRVMNLNGTPVGWSGSLIRNLIRFVDVLPGCYAFGCISVMVSRNFQRLGDLAARTIVVHQPKRDAATATIDAEPIALTVPLSLDEQHAIVSFAERSVMLNTQRADELAAIVEPILPGADTRQLRGLASWLSGSSSS